MQLTTENNTENTIENTAEKTSDQPLTAVTAQKRLSTKKHLLQKKLKRNLNKSALPNALMHQLIDLFSQRNFEVCAQRALTLTLQYPNEAFAWKVLGAARQNLGQIEAAFDALNIAAKLLPNDADAQYNYANGLYDLNRLDEAICAYQKTLNINPTFATAYFNLAVIFQAQKHALKAEKNYQACLNLDANHMQAHNHLALLLNDLGRLQEAETHYRKAIDIHPQFSEALNNLAILLKETGRLAEAETYYKKALDIDPASAETHNNLGNLLKEKGDFEGAEQCFNKAILLNPAYDAAYCNLGVALFGLNRLDKAEMAYISALDINPNNVVTLSNYSVTLNELGQLKKAEACLEKAHAINPNFIDVYTNATKNWLDQGCLNKAEQSIVKSLKIQPDYLKGQANLLFSINYSASHSPEACLMEAKKYGDMVAKTVEKKYATWQVAAHPSRLKVGLVSGDFRNHSVAHFLKNVLSHIDVNNIALVAYSTKATEDDVTQSIKKHCSDYQSIASLTDQQAAQKIHQDGIHVLIDLSGHTEGSRLALFGWKPAPIQASWLGYFASTGLPEIDYFIADAVSVPPENHAQFVEKLKYLPNTRLCFTPPAFDISVAKAPCLANGHITFGCFQNMAKVNDEVLDVWAEVFKALPNAKFRWYCKSFKDAAMVTELNQQFAERGIALERISLLASVSREQYFAKHAEVDMILDTFPFPGGTTTCEALWIGVPTLTLVGNTLIARQGASVLTAAGLTDWIAESKEDYICKAIAFANNPQLLNALRATLREKVLASPLFDGALFAKNFEKALWEMWAEKNNSQALQQNNTPQKVNKTALSVVISSATRLHEKAFWESAALGISLKKRLQQDPRLQCNIAFNNASGLSDVFNAQILQADAGAILVFMHDDVWIDEENFFDAVIAGLENFDVIGVAGNKRILPNQPSWLFKDANFVEVDAINLSGKIGHGNAPYGEEQYYGDMPAACELLDGVFLAVKKQTLTKNNLTFDAQFGFHFYDLDFCRTVRKAGLTLGTWPIGLTHQSGGGFGSAAWTEVYMRYVDKWQDGGEVKFEDIREKFSNGIEDVYNIALQHQLAGNDQEAESLYLQILEINPTHADANHNLGYIETHNKNVHQALPRFEAAVLAKPSSEQCWVSYIDALIMAGETLTAASAIEHGQQFGLTKASAEMLTEEIDQLLLNNNAFLSNVLAKINNTDVVKFIIVAPAYTQKSAGIRVLHELCDDLNNLGYPCAISFMGTQGLSCSNDAALYGPQLKWYALRDKNELDHFVDNGIVIYPEIVTGNPLNAKRVVRYILNSEGQVAKNKMDAQPTDFMMAYAPAYYQNPDALLVKLPFDAIFNSDNTLPALERKMDVTYIGKGSTFDQCFIVPNSLEVTRQYPITKPELAIVLKNTRYFYTWDYRSATVTEALLCGAIPVFMSCAPFASFDDLDNLELAKLLKSRLTRDGNDYNVSLPANYAAILNQVKVEYLEVVHNYPPKLKAVLQQMKTFFKVNI